MDCVARVRPGKIPVISFEGSGNNAVGTMKRRKNFRGIGDSLAFLDFSAANIEILGLRQ